MRFEDNSVEIKDSAGPRKRSSSIAKIIRRKKKKDHNVPKVSFLELLKLNQPDWYIVLVGVIGSAVMGCLFPLMSLIFSDVLRVSLSSFIYLHLNLMDDNLLCGVSNTHACRCLVYQIGKRLWRRLSVLWAVS